MQTSIEMLIDALTKNIVPTTEADQEDLARNGAFYIAITTAKVFQQREKDLILSAFDSKFKGTAEEFYNACFNAKVCKFVKWKRNNPTQLSKQFSKLKND